MKKDKKRVKKQNNRTDRHFRRFQLETFAVFTGLIILFAAMILGSAVSRSGEALEQNTSSLITATSRQIQLNINAYLEKIESTSALLFSDEKYYEYDASDPSMSDYDKLQREDEISQRIVDIGLMDSFADFGIIYSNDHSVGWLSNTTQNMFDSGKGMYNDFSRYITNQYTDDGWTFGVHGNVDRMYYVKRLNPDAILVASFFNRELDSIFDMPDELKGMTIRLVDSAHNILFSTNSKETGTKISDSLAARCSSGRIIATKYDDTLLNVNQCDNNWRIVCTMPTSIVLQSINQLKTMITVMTVIFLIITLTLGSILFRRISKPVDGLVSNLELKATLDPLAGTMNRVSYVEAVTQAIESSKPGAVFAMVIMDADHFKSINDTLGHAYGDQVISRMGQLLNKHFKKTSIAGRIGGDEFSAFACWPDTTIDAIKPGLTECLEDLYKDFSREFEKENEEVGLSLSMGICLDQWNSHTAFDYLYTHADLALYKAKESGRSRYIFYDENEE